MAHAVVLGEALFDLFESECDGESIYRPMVGGAPLNVAVGIARLGWPAEFLGSVSSDVLGDRIVGLLQEQGVGTGGVLRVDTPTTLAVTSLRDGVPTFHFYGEPPSYALLGPEHLDVDLIATSSVLYCGSIGLMRPTGLAAARAAWSVPGPLRTLDPNVRPTLMRDRPALRAVIEEFAATADLVKLSDADATALFDLSAESVAQHLRALGARAVVVTRGPLGALAAVPGGTFTISPPEVRAIDTTGAGDASMAGLLYGLLAHGRPSDLDGWRGLVSFATAAAALACEVRGGATAMPRRAEVEARRV